MVYIKLYHLLSGLDMHFNKILAFIAIYGLTVSQAAVSRCQNHKQPWNLEEVLRAGSRIRGFNGTWITDNEFYYTAPDKSIHKFNAASVSDSIFVTSDFLNHYNTSSSFQLSPDNTKILVRYDVEKIFRHSSIAKYDVFDITTQKFIKIHMGEKLQYCGWSPRKNRLAGVYNNNVFVHFEDGLEIQLTSDGINGVFYNGIPDWVYEEEVLRSGSAMWWSKDSNYLTVGVFNDTNVKTFKYFLYGKANDLQYQYPKEVNMKYPKPGTNNPVVALRVFNLSNIPDYVTIKAPVNVVSHDNILQSVAWTSDCKLLITWLNRRQDIASLQLCSAAGKCHEVNHIEEPKGWVAISSPICLKNTQHCLFTYWIGNWYQVWKLNLQTGKNVWKSRGNFTILKVYGYDEVNDKLYYQATLDSNSSIYHVFRNRNCLTCNLRDEKGGKCLSAAATFSLDYSYFSVSCNGPNPSFTKIFKTENKTEVKDWEANTDFRATLSTKLRSEIKFMNVPLADGSIGIAKLQFPPNLDKSKKYPMIISVYGGPNSVTITRRFNVDIGYYMSTNRNVIYVRIDGRGTGNKGKDLLFSVNNHLGEFEVEDQISVTKYLQTQLPFIDKDRCGIWGWSYGGYVTARTLANDTNRVFKCGCSVAPVTSWLYYDTIYTERYMGLPTENLEKYLDTSVLQQVENFRKHDFLLIHGSADDNVHYQHSLMLSDVLQRNNITFKAMTYIDEDHSIQNFHLNLFNNIDQFFIKCFGKKKEF